MITVQHLTEPFLQFGGGGLHISPKSGIARYGPWSWETPRHPHHITIGLVGTAEAMESAQAWVAESSEGVLGDVRNPEFPGCLPDRGFFAQVTSRASTRGLISHQDLSRTLAIRRKQERFEAVIQLFVEHIRLVAEADDAPDAILIAISSDVFKRSSGVDIKMGTERRHRDLHDALKAECMRFRIPTQLLRAQTAEGKDKTPASRIAWNFFTGLYYKAGGLPWAPHRLTPATCFIGITFFRYPGSHGSMNTSLVQAFDEHGEGLVLRGPTFEWDPRKTGIRSPHLDEDSAHQLVATALDRYQAEMRTTPCRVVIHKSSRFLAAERAGFEATLGQQVDTYDLVALESQDRVRLLPEAMYPPLRGTWLTLGSLDYLYTTGFVSELQEFHGTHVPTPLRITDHIGYDTGRRAILEEILALTKMNWNSSQLGGLLPVTLMFSRKVADVLKELPAGTTPLPQFRFYI